MTYGTGNRPAGWYDTGGGWAAYWNGQAWTGDRMVNTQRWPGPGQPPPPAANPGRAPGRGLPWWAWIILILLAIFVGLPLLAAFAEGFTTGLSGR